MPDQLHLGFRERDARLETMLNNLHAHYSVQVYDLNELIRTEHNSDRTDYVEQLAEAKRMLGFVHDAIKRQTKGGYGLCHSCGQEIQEKHLLALPFRIDCPACEDRATPGQLVTKSKSRLPLLRDLG